MATVHRVAIVAAMALAAPHARGVLERGDALDCVVKLGGSALTDKATFETLNREALAATAASIGRLMQQGERAPRLAIVHGAGSFGHHHAKEYSIQQGRDAHADSALGFAKTRSSVTRLNALVVKALVDHGVPAVGISPFPTWRTSSRSIHTDALDAVERALRAGLVPVLHGDAVLDETQGFAILSGDELVLALGLHLRPSHAVFLMDVPGVYDRPPTEADAALIERIAVDAAGRATLSGAPRGAAVRTATASHDVTGGLEAKLRSARDLARAGIPTYLARVGTPAAERAISGEPPGEGTVIARSE